MKNIIFRKLENKRAAVKSLGLIFIFSFVCFLIFSLIGYEFMYQYKIIFGNIIISLLVMIIILVFLFIKFRAIIVLISIMAGLYLSLLSSPSFVWINLLRINLTSPDLLPKQDVQIVSWGGGGFFQSFYYFHLMNSQKMNTIQIEKRFYKNMGFTYRTDINCTLKQYRISEIYILIGSTC